MKQEINVGQVVDDGTGDYLRTGAIKTRDNFNEIYRDLGDGNTIYAAGAWRNWQYAGTYLNGDTVWTEANAEQYFDANGDGQGPEIRVGFGESWTIDTTNGEVNVTLPPGVEEADYGKSIRVRDVKGTWSKFKVVIYPDLRDSIKRVASSTAIDLGSGAEFTNAYQDLELVFTPPRHWEYVAQKYVNGLTFGDVPSVLRKSLIAREGQRDFNMTLQLDGGEYNKAAVEVYRRGNLMYYGDELNDLSDYGSTPMHLVPAWIASNPTPYYVGDLVIGDPVAGRDDRIWQCIQEHNSTGVWEDVYWTELMDKPTFVYWAVSTAYEIGDLVIKEYDGIDEQYECIVAHTSPAVDEDLTASPNWTRITNGDLAPLDGKTIRLRLPANLDDPIAMVTYLSDVSSFRSSYEMHHITVLDELNHVVDAVEGQTVKKEMIPGMSLSLVDFGLPDYVQFNVNTVEVLVNGTQLIPPNQAGLSDSDQGTDYDYDPIQDSEGRWNTFVFNEQLQDNDVVSVRWFDNVIGTLLSWDDGDDNIQSRSREIFVSRDDWTDVRRFNRMSYTDTQNPSAGTAEIDPVPESFEPAGTLTSLFESIYPVGSVYINANNPSNPADYMGFGTWVRYGEGQAIVGWNSQDDGKFHRNNNNGNLVQAGGTGGAIGVQLIKENIPELISTVNPTPEDLGSRDISDPSEQYSLVARAPESGGNINLNGCLGDPSDTVALAYYNEEPIKVNHGQVAEAVDVTQPFITAYTWIRTA